MRLERTARERLVSLVMPVRNCERYVGAAISSALAQSVPPREIVVVDDGSTDGTSAVLAGFGPPVRVLEQEPHGQFHATNRAVAATTAPVLAFLDADDLLTPDSLAVRIDRLLAEDAPEAVSGRTQQFISPELLPEAAERFRFDPRPVAGALFQTTLIRRDAFDRIGPLRSDLSTSANIDWMSRARAGALRLVGISDVVALRRLHDSNVGITRAVEKQGDLLTVVRAHRQRLALPEQDASEC